MFHDPADFAFTGRLESAWPEVRAELDGLEEADFFDWYESGAYSGAWQVCGLYAAGHPESHRIAPAVVQRCPRTVELASAVPGVHFAAFSRLGPRAIIHPHRDGGPRALRCHLGVKVPARTVFRVGAEQRCWEEGRCIVFDGSTQHAAWNESDQARIVLLVEFIPEWLR